MTSGHRQFPVVDDSGYLPFMIYNMRCASFGKQIRLLAPSVRTRNESVDHEAHPSRGLWIPVDTCDLHSLMLQNWPCSRPNLGFNPRVCPKQSLL